MGDAVVCCATGVGTGTWGVVPAAAVGTGVAALVFFALSVQPATAIAPMSRTIRQSVTTGLALVRLFMVFYHEIHGREYTLFR
jgi:hypothetical protein